MFLTLVPAYGRDYKSGKSVQEDFNGNKDFLIADFLHPYYGKPINREQIDPGTTVVVRYKNRTRIKSFQIP